MNWARFAISGSVGFIIAIVVAICIEQCGGAIGGIITSMPTTILPTSYVFLTEAGRTPLEQSESLFAAPIGIRVIHCVTTRYFCNKPVFPACMEDSPCKAGKTFQQHCSDVHYPLCFIRYMVPCRLLDYLD